MYEANVSAAKASQLLKKGYDVTDIAYRRGGATIDIVLTRAQRDGLRADGVKLTLQRTRSGKTVRQAAAAQAAGGYAVSAPGMSPGGSATSSTGWRVTTATWSS